MDSAIVAVEAASVGPDGWARAATATGLAAVGRVVECEPGAAHLAGQRVLVGRFAPCGECDVCRRGGATVCPVGTTLGEGVQGALVDPAGRLAAPARWLIPLEGPLDVPPAPPRPCWATRRRSRTRSTPARAWARASPPSSSVTTRWRGCCARSWWPSTPRRSTSRCRSMRRRCARGWSRPRPPPATAPGRGRSSSPPAPRPAGASRWRSPARGRPSRSRRRPARAGRSTSPRRWRASSR